jgi:hypothetical protein
MITDPETIRFVNEVIRPMAESLRGIKSRIDGAVDTYARLVPNIPDDGTLLDDGREAEGVSRLTGADIRGFANVMGDLKARLELDGVRQKLEKPTVRPLRVEQ